MTDTRSCRRHRVALADLAERREPAGGGQAALDHVDRCPDCAQLLGELMLTVVALRRLATEGPVATVLVDPAQRADAAWARLRERIERSSRAAREQAWRWRTTLGGLAMASLAVAALVGPATIHLTADGATGELSGYTDNELDILHWQTEAGYVSAARSGSLTATAPGPVTSRPTNIGRYYPDGIRPERKEVQPARTTVRLPEAR
jgi:hypothetical protein